MVTVGRGEWGRGYSFATEEHGGPFHGTVSYVRCFSGGILYLDDGKVFLCVETLPQPSGTCPSTHPSLGVFFMRACGV